MPLYYLSAVMIGLGNGHMYPALWTEFKNSCIFASTLDQGE